MPLHEAGPWTLVDERTELDNFHTSLYGEGYDGLLLARGNQNGSHRQDMALMRAAPEMLSLLREARFQISGETADRIDALVLSLSPT